jgi:hypothetical protein
MKNIRRIARQIFRKAEKGRKGKGPWMVWFPRKTQQYVSRPIKTKGDLQALGSWLAAETEGRNWHNTVFQDHKKVIYRGREYSKNEGKLLFNKIIKNNDWESVDMGSPDFTPQVDNSLKTVDSDRWVTTPRGTFG